MVIGQVNPQTKRATFRFHVNPLVSWIWLGVLVMMSGAGISLWPEVSWRKLGAWGFVRIAAGATTGIMFAILLASTSASNAKPSALSNLPVLPGTP
jgi:cytochrome c-type biogenesis protein CcmF